MANNQALNQTFFQRNRAYLYTALGLGVVGAVFVGLMMIMDWGYLFGYTLHVLTGGGVQGVLTPPRIQLSGDGERSLRPRL